MKIHFLSNSPKMNTGFSIVTKNLTLELEKLGHEVSVTGLQTTYLEENYYDVKTLPLVTEQPEDIQFQNNIMEVDPDVVIYVGGMYSVEDPIGLTKMFPKMICYSPIEGSRIPKRMVNDLNDVVKNGGRVVAQCRYGYEEMKRCGVNVDRYIYHGYNPNIFKVGDVGAIGTENEIVSFLKWWQWDDEKGKEKRWTRFDIPITELGKQFKGKFVYLFVGANHALRKRIERLLKAYSLLIEESKQLRDRMRLHLHTMPTSTSGINLFDIADELGINDSISFSFGGNFGCGYKRGCGWSENSLSVMYNMADIFVSATSSEGFGLGHLESMACGLPNIAPACTSLTEIIGDDKDESKNRGLLSRIESEFMIQDGSYRSLVDVNDLSSNMKKLYIDKELRERYSKNCLSFVKSYTWDKVAAEFDKVIKEMK